MASSTTQLLPLCVVVLTSWACGSAPPTAPVDSPALPLADAATHRPEVTPLFAPPPDWPAWTDRVQVATAADDWARCLLPATDLATSKPGAVEVPALIPEGIRLLVQDLDDDRRTRRFTTSCEAGDASGCQALMWSAFEKNSYDEVLRWSERACSLDNAGTCRALLERLDRAPESLGFPPEATGNTEHTMPLLWTGVVAPFCGPEAPGICPYIAAVLTQSADAPVDVLLDACDVGVHGACVALLRGDDTIETGPALAPSAEDETSSAATKWYRVLQRAADRTLASCIGGKKDACMETVLLQANRQGAEADPANGNCTFASSPCLRSAAERAGAGERYGHAWVEDVAARETRWSKVVAGVCAHGGAKACRAAKTARKRVLAGLAVLAPCRRGDMCDPGGEVAEDPDHDHRLKTQAACRRGSSHACLVMAVFPADAATTSDGVDIEDDPARVFQRVRAAAERADTRCTSRQEGHKVGPTHGPFDGEACEVAARLSLWGCAHDGTSSEVRARFARACAAGSQTSCEWELAMAYQAAAERLCRDRSDTLACAEAQRIGSPWTSTWSNEVSDWVADSTRREASSSAPLCEAGDWRACFARLENQETDTTLVARAAWFARGSDLLAAACRDKGDMACGFEVVLGRSDHRSKVSRLDTLGQP